jgi:hypothetical protein
MIEGWTEEKPTKPGLYWYWESEISNPYIVEVGDAFEWWIIKRWGNKR